MSTDPNKALALRFHDEIFSLDRLHVADEILAHDFVVRSPGLPTISGPEGVKEFARMLRNAFPEYRLTSEEPIADGDRVVIRWTHRGAQRGEFLGIPPTGREVTITGIDVFRIEGGRLAELWESWDEMGLRRQLGVVSDVVASVA